MRVLRDPRGDKPTTQREEVKQMTLLDLQGMEPTGGGHGGGGGGGDHSGLSALLCGGDDSSLSIVIC
jgi:hypothetical protein